MLQDSPRKLVLGIYYNVCPLGSVIVLVFRLSVCSCYALHIIHIRQLYFR